MELMLSTTLQDEFRAFCVEQNQHQLLHSPLASALSKSQEAAVNDQWLYINIRPRVAHWKCIRYNFSSRNLDIVNPIKFLKFKEIITKKKLSHIPEIDFSPYERHFPMMHQEASIGHGVDFLNRHISSRLSQDQNKGSEILLSFLKKHSHDNLSLMINDKISTLTDLQKALQLGIHQLGDYPLETEWKRIEGHLATLGFQPGWGRTVKDIQNNLNLLANILEAPDHKSIEHFLSRIPMIFNITVISPHGFFDQKYVSGLPDTGSQVVYILDQVKALEKEMQQRLYNQGLDINPQILIITHLIPEAGTTTCNQKEEQVVDTKHVKIIRIPFRHKDGSIVPHCISRFKIWPFLERFAQEVQDEIHCQLKCPPDLVIGNYSDGNLVAYLLAQKLNITQCHIAHTLEKTKHIYSDLYWQEMEQQYHFSCQFTADLISMNAADFIITSTYQEIAGSSNVVGQYESYTTFTMPELQRVLHGINVFDPKFNIVSPGVDPRIYFPFHHKKQRFHKLHDELDQLIFGKADECTLGSFSNPEKPILFSMARFNKVKNITGLIQWYGESAELRDCSNLLIVGGNINPDLCDNREQKEQVEAVHRLIDKHQLNENIRWLGLRLERNLKAELYRFLADRQSAFILPAFFESFGVTIIEAMASGLPPIATCFGGPLEIIENNLSGLHIDPNHGDQAAKIITDFFLRCRQDSDYWHTFSQNAIERIENHYTWKKHSKRLLTLACIYESVDLV